MSDQPKVKTADSGTKLDDIIRGLPPRPGMSEGLNPGSVWYYNRSKDQYVIVTTALDVARAPSLWRVIYRRVDDPLQRMPLILDMESFRQEFTRIGS